MCYLQVEKGSLYEKYFQDTVNTETLICVTTNYIKLFAYIVIILPLNMQTLQLKISLHLSNSFT